MEEREQPTQKQKEVLKSHIDSKYNLFKCPLCEEEWNAHRIEVENPGEEETQVYCLYGCGYIFLNEKNK